MKKGIELPLNTLIILVIVVIVLLAIALLFMTVWGGGASGIALYAAKNSACAKLQSMGCSSGSLSSIHFNADVTGSGGIPDGKVDESDTLQAYCEKIACVGKDLNSCCRIEICQCGGISTGTAVATTPVTTTATAAGTATGTAVTPTQTATATQTPTSTTTSTDCSGDTTHKCVGSTLQEYNSYKGQWEQKYDCVSFGKTTCGCDTASGKWACK